LLRGYTQTENYHYKGKKIPPVPVDRILGGYYLTEGNHRLYVCKLLAKNTILANVTEYDYVHMLKNSTLHILENEYCFVIYNNQNYELSYQEAMVFQLLQNELR